MVFPHLSCPVKTPPIARLDKTFFSQGWGGVGRAWGRVALGLNTTEEHIERQNQRHQLPEATAGNRSGPDRDQIGTRSGPDLGGVGWGGDFSFF